jgi:RimJ/RimL family protein N-acetyltransferase
MELRLRPLRVGDEPQAREAHRELAADEFTFLLDWDPVAPWTSNLEKLDSYRRGVDLPGDRVPATFLVADLGGEIVGRVSIQTPREPIERAIPAFAAACPNASDTNCEPWSE